MLRSIPLRLKLLAALVLPMLVVGFYLYVDVTDSIERRDVAAAQRAEVDAFQAVSEVSSAIGVEHLLMNARDADRDQLAAARAATDASYEALRSSELPISVERLQLIDGHYGTLLSIRETLGADPTEARLRANIELRNGEGRTGPNSTSLADLAELPLDVLAAFEFDPNAIDDVATSSLVDDYFLVQRARADVRREASTLLRVATLPGNLVDAEVTESVSAVLAETDESLEVLAQLASIDVAGDVDSMLVAPAWTRYDAFRLAVDAVEVGERVDVDEGELRVAAGEVDSLLRLQSEDIVEELEGRASASVFDANRDVVISGLVGLWLLIGVGLLLRFLYRAIKRPLERLTHKAGHVARVELPSIIDGMRSGEIDDVPEIERIPVESKDEVGTLVEAFNDMHRSAVDLAAGQANSRRVVADMFVNLGRRNQRLVGRLLNGLSMLEQHEQDPDKLAALYDLDHTATRMRRNAESLLVLAGAGQARRWDEPIPIDDVARAAISEVEGYQRVTIDVNGEERLDGATVSDVSHLLAELVENALTFSPPNSPVEVVAGRTSSGYVIAVADNGIGMLPDQIDEVNERIAKAADEDETPSEFLGHYVVGRLAARHGIRVVVSEGPAGGVTARVWLPTRLLVDPSTLLPDLDPASPSMTSVLDQLTHPTDADAAYPPVPPAAAVPPVEAPPAPIPAAPVAAVPPPVEPVPAPVESAPASPVAAHEPVEAASNAPESAPAPPVAAHEPVEAASNAPESAPAPPVSAPEPAKTASPAPEPEPAPIVPARSGEVGATPSPVMPPPLDPALAPLSGTGPIEQALPDVSDAPLAPSSDTTDFLASLEAAGIQQRTSKLPEAGPDLRSPDPGSVGSAPPEAAVSPPAPSPAPVTPPSTPMPEVVPGAPSVPASTPHAATIDALAPTAVPEPDRGSVDSDVTGELATIAPVAAPATGAPVLPADAEPLRPIAEDTTAAEASPFGATRRQPGAHMPKTELIGSIVGSMGSILDESADAPVTTPAAPTTEPTAPPTQAPPAPDALAGDPDRIRSALSGFQQGVARADREQVER